MMKRAKLLGRSRNTIIHISRLMHKGSSDSEDDKNGTVETLESDLFVSEDGESKNQVETRRQLNLVDAIKYEDFK